jgi:hypothetical protein
VVEISNTHPRSNYELPLTHFVEPREDSDDLEQDGEESISSFAEPSLVGFAIEFSTIVSRYDQSINEKSSRDRMKSLAKKSMFLHFTCFWFLAEELGELFPFYHDAGKVQARASVFSGLVLDKTPDGLITTFMTIVLGHLAAVDVRALANSNASSLQGRARAALELMVSGGITVETFIVKVLHRSAFPKNVFLTGDNWIKAAFGVSKNARDPRMSHMALAQKFNGLMQENLNQLKLYLRDEGYTKNIFRFGEWHWRSLSTRFPRKDSGLLL